MPQRQERRPFVLDFEVPRKWQASTTRPKKPVVAMVRLVNLYSRGNEIRCRFSRGVQNVDVSSAYELSQLFLRVGRGDFSFDGGIDPKPKKPFRSPLSLNNQAYCYIVYMLTNKNWQFASKYSPITVSRLAYDKQGAYAEAARINRNGDVVHGDVEENECRAAYFIADADAAYEPEIKGFDDRINLHVDLRFKDDDGKTILMPIIIDPDVRHPGGSGY